MYKQQHNSYGKGPTLSSKTDLSYCQSNVNKNICVYMNPGSYQQTNTSLTKAHGGKFKQLEMCMFPMPFTTNIKLTALTF